MKIIALLVASASLGLSGCATYNRQNAGTFLAKIAQMDISAADVSQSTVTPFYSHDESVSGLHHDQRSFSVENLKANFSVPLWGVTWKFSASAITAGDRSAVAQVANVAAPDTTAK